MYQLAEINNRKTPEPLVGGAPLSEYLAKTHPLALCSNSHVQLCKHYDPMSTPTSAAAAITAGSTAAAQLAAFYAAYEPDSNALAGILVGYTEGCVVTVGDLTQKLFHKFGAVPSGWPGASAYRCIYIHV